MVLGWLWGSSSTNDSLKNLDPDLQKILNSQDSQKSTLPLASFKSQKTYTEQLRESGELSSHQSQSQSQSQQDTSSSQPKVPPQSLFQDGRYAHLWKNYEPQHVVESRGETELDKLKRLQDNNESRKVQLGQAALENCVFEQMAEMDCVQNGGIHRKLTMCRTEKKEFLRCYEMQRKFLKALGYWDALGDVSSERADAIQMHSDKLWGRLKEQEREIERAKEEGRELPVFESILSKRNLDEVGGKVVQPQIPKQAFESSEKAADPNYAYPSIPLQMRDNFNKRIQNMSAADAKVEEAVFLAELEQQRQHITEAGGYLRAEGEARRKRYETGEASIGDRIKQWTGWDKWDSQFPLPADAQARQAQQAGGDAKR